MLDETIVSLNFVQVIAGSVLRDALDVLADQLGVDQRADAVVDQTTVSVGQSCGDGLRALCRDSWPVSRRRRST